MVYLELIITLKDINKTTLGKLEYKTKTVSVFTWSVNPPVVLKE